MGALGQGRALPDSGVYSMVYMATRTQIYLTDEQRARLRERSRATGVPMSRLIRDAIDALLVAEDDLDATFGSAPNIAGRVPSRSDWDLRG
jgi:predicted DNA-binding protein